MDPTQYTKSAHGLGMWSAFRPKGADGKTPRDAKALAEELRAMGVTWWAPRVGDYGKISDFTEEAFTALCVAFKEAGLAVLPWYYSRPQFWQKEVGVAKRLMELGASGIIIDAEIEWTNKHGEAKAYGYAMRAALGDAYIAHAPLAWMQYHPAWPYAEFGAWVDQVMPQAYWTELRHGKYDEGKADDFDTAVLPMWEELAKQGDCRAKNYAPIACTYGREEMAKAGQAVANRPPGTFKPGDLAKFFARYEAHDESLGGVRRTLSLYSYEVASPTALEEIKARTERIRGADTKPIPKATKEECK